MGKNIVTPFFFVAIVFFVIMWNKRAILHDNKIPFRNVWETDDGTGVTNEIKIIDLISKVDSLLIENGIVIVPVFGTLLGFIRDKGMIPWDYNVDVAVESSDYDRLFEIAPLGAKHGVTIEKTDGILRLSSNGEWPWIRVNRMERRGDMITISKKSAKVAVKSSDMFPYRSNLFKGVPMRMPNNPDAILTSLYGPKWETMCVSSSSDPLTRDYYKTRFVVNCSDIRYKWSSIFDNVWVINLERRGDRWDKTRKQLEDIGINPKRWEAIDAKSPEFLKLYDSITSYKVSPPEAACFMSHKNLWNHLYETDVPYAIIFEDDILIPDGITKKDITSALENSKGFNILFLGYCWSTMSFNIKRFKSPETKSGSAMCLHAYVISRAAIARMLNNAVDYSKPIDHITQEFCNKELCFVSKHVKTRRSYGSGLIHQTLDLESDLRNRGKNR